MDNFEPWGANNPRHSAYRGGYQPLQSTADDFSYIGERGKFNPQTPIYGPVRDPALQVAPPVNTHGTVSTSGGTPYTPPPMPTVVQSQTAQPGPSADPSPSTNMTLMGASTGNPYAAAAGGLGDILMYQAGLEKARKQRNLDAEMYNRQLEENKYQYGEQLKNQELNIIGTAEQGRISALSQMINSLGIARG